ncbi:unnamed protein product [Adineta steineri]|uniref:Uncharacterized protein n=1 Tax=Adineta steineri TaxID=433720 RepID=A0A815S8Q8_9BILA|nr:unnamed protein product [Adineta steineri]CAF4038443.1 unnamed protein product [Adineta steineri]CAF4179775.1 unnamed protein product [Adineta steineri]
MGNTHKSSPSSFIAVIPPPSSSIAVIPSPPSSVSNFPSETSHVSITSSPLPPVIIIQSEPPLVSLITPPLPLSLVVPSQPSPSLVVPSQPSPSLVVPSQPSPSLVVPSQPSPSLVVPSQSLAPLVVLSPLPPLVILESQRKTSKRSYRSRLTIKPPTLLKIASPPLAVPVEPTTPEQTNPSARPRRIVKPVRRLNYIRRPKKVVDHATTAATTTTAAATTTTTTKKQTKKQKKTEPVCKQSDKQLIELFTKFLSYRAENNNPTDAAPSESSIRIIPKFEYDPLAVHKKKKGIKRSHSMI